MGTCRILIVEDDPLVSAHIASIVEETVDAEVLVSASIAGANAALATPLDFAFLDVDVLDGTTYAFAASLSTQGVSFAFVSASDRAKMPGELRHVPFIAKPYVDADIADMLKTSVRAA